MAEDNRVTVRNRTGAEFVVDMPESNPATAYYLQQVDQGDLTIVTPEGEPKRPARKPKG